MYFRISSSSFLSETISKVETFMAVSGSFNPLPVKIVTTLEPFAILPFSTDLITPANDAAEPGSTKIPSVPAINL
jgi:hypothetical protein